MVDWVPEDRDPDVWLARWLDGGWRRVYPCTGTEVVINGQLVHRFALIRDAKRCLAWDAARRVTHSVTHRRA